MWRPLIGLPYHVSMKQLVHLDVRMPTHMPSQCTIMPRGNLGCGHVIIIRL
jgi:hypothetical protein